MSSLYILVFVMLVIVAVGNAALRRRHLSGKRGEAVVAGRLSSLPADEYHIVNDVMLPTKDGTTTQVDHVVVSRFGIFVIETKDYSGWIFGDEKQPQWTQCLHAGYGRTEKHKFQNPIRQNWRHICVMSDLLGVPKDRFKSVVAFCGNADFKTAMPEGVMYSRALAGYIASFRDPVVSTKNVPEIVSALREWESTLSEKRKQDHVANLKTRHDPSARAEAVQQGELKCPRCGSKMVLRHRRSDGGVFYGCSKYPACRGVLKAE